MTLHRYRQLNDVHLSDQPPSGRTASYLDDILAKLDWAVTVTSDVEAIIITGDLMHRKNAAHTTHRTVQRIRDILLCGTPIYIVPGNHDEAHGGGLDGQPLLSVVDGRRVRLLTGRAYDRPLIAGVPWSNDFERENGAAAFAAAVSRASDGDGRHLPPAPLVFAHAPISLHPYPFGPEAQGWLLAADLVPLLPEHVRLVAHGHMHGGHHVDQWSRARAGNEWLANRAAALSVTPDLTFSNPGALARASLSTDDVARRPAVADIAYDDATGSVEVRYYEVDVARPAGEVLRLERHARAARRDGTVEALAAHLGSAEAEVVDADTMRAHLQSLTRPEDVSPDLWQQGLGLASAALDGVS